MCIWISICTSRISSAQEPRVASGSCIVQCKSRMKKAVFEAGQKHSYKKYDRIHRGYLHLSITIFESCVFSVPYGFPLIFREAFEILVFSAVPRSFLWFREREGSSSPRPHLSRGIPRGRCDSQHTAPSLLALFFPKFIMKSLDFVSEENCFSSQFLFKVFIP